MGSMGEIIGRIDGSVGNAISPQLHFELKVENDSIDPLPLIEQFYKDDVAVTGAIQQYKGQLVNSIKERDQLVKQFLKNNPPTH